MKKKRKKKTNGTGEIGKWNKPVLVMPLKLQSSGLD